jgi:drug/metabolite transporter (DMT)-like permease
LADANHIRRDPSRAVATDLLFTLSIAVVGTAVLGGKLDHRPWSPYGGAADVDDALSLAVRDRVHAAVRAAACALNYTTATNGVILNSFIPVMIIAMSWIFLHQRLSGLQIVGVIVSFFGVLAILSQGSIERLLAFRLNIGDLFVVGSITIWATYTVCLRWRPPNLHPLTFLFVIACVGVVQMLPLYIGEVALGKSTHWSWQVVLAFAGMGLFSSFMAYVFWTQGVTEVGASVAGLFLHLMPVYGTLLAWLFLDERPEAFHFIGIAMILSGIYITSRRASVPVPAAPE